MYSVKFLNDEEFNQLPAKNIESKIGVAYPETGEAFVRQSGSRAMDVFTALHEIEHLHGNDLDEHFDHENGCYYKSDFVNSMNPVGGNFLGLGNGNKFGNIMEKILPVAAAFFAPQVIPALMPGYGAAAGAGYATNAGAIGQSMGMGLGTGTAAGSAAASGAGLGASAGLGAKIGSLSSKVGEQVGTNYISNLLTPQPQMPDSFNAFQPEQQFVQQESEKQQDPNVIQVPQSTNSLNPSIGMMRDKMKTFNPDSEYGNYSGRAF